MSLVPGLPGSCLARYGPTQALGVSTGISRKLDGIALAIQLALRLPAVLPARDDTIPSVGRDRPDRLPVSRAHAPQLDSERDAVKLARDAGSRRPAPEFA